MENKNLFNLIERLSELLRVDLRQVGAVHGLQPVQIEVLHYLGHCNRFSDTPMAVTEYLGQTKGTVSQTLKVLENKAYVEKQPDEDDKRVSHLKLTQRGKALLTDLIPSPVFKLACDSLSQRQQSVLETELGHLVGHLLKANAMKSFGICKTCHYNQQQDNGEYYCHLVNQPLSNSEIDSICREHKTA